MIRAYLFYRGYAYNDISQKLKYILYGNFINRLGVVALLVIVLIYSSLSWGFVLFKFYGWFLIPVFTQLPAINCWKSVGLMFIIGLFCIYSGEHIKKEFKDAETGQSIFVNRSRVVRVDGEWV